jgi:hypothetical protein
VLVVSKKQTEKIVQLPDVDITQLNNIQTTSLDSQTNQSAKNLNRVDYHKSLKAHIEFFNKTATKLIDSEHRSEQEIDKDEFMDRRIFREVSIVDKKQFNLSYPTNPSKPSENNEEMYRSLNEIIVQDRLFKNAYTEVVF